MLFDRSSIVVDENWAEMPIPTLRYDTGYREVKVVPAPAELATELVPLPMQIPFRNVYSRGPVLGVCDYYGRGVGAPHDPLIYKYMASPLLQLQAMLGHFNLGILPVDCWRSPDTQRRIWENRFEWQLSEHNVKRADLGTAEFLRIGLLADDICSYAPVIQNDEFLRLRGNIETSSMMAEISEAAVGMLAKWKPEKKTTEEWVHDLLVIYLTFRQNLGELAGIFLNPAGNRAHAGSAIDAMLIDLLTGMPALMGVWFDCCSEATPMNAFERDDLVTWYTALVAASPDLQRYLLCFGIERVTETVCRTIQKNRRVYFWATQHVKPKKLCVFAGECWHLDGPGSPCWAVVYNQRDEAGELYCYDNPIVATEQAQAYFAAHPEAL